MGYDVERSQLEILGEIVSDARDGRGGADRSATMQTVQMKLEETLVAEVEMALQLGTTRSAFTREALREALEKIREQELERRHKAGGFLAHRHARRDG